MPERPEEPGNANLGPGAAEYQNLPAKGLSQEDKEKARILRLVHEDASFSLDNQLGRDKNFDRQLSELEQAKSESWSPIVKSAIRDKEAEIQEARALLGQERKMTQEKYDANLWRAKQHVDEHLPGYKQTAAEEMKAKSGQDFETNQKESPGFVQPEGPEQPQ